MYLACPKPWVQFPALEKKTLEGWEADIIGKKFRISSVNVIFQVSGSQTFS
jgi:hypothetical protein